MTPEAAVHRVDLSDDASWDQIQGEDALSQQEKDYLKEKFNEESEGIIYLSKQELAELKQIVGIPMDTSRDIALSSFIDGQKTEGLALSDIVESNEAIPDIIRAQIEAGIDGYETIAKEQLFGAEGVFSALDISDSAQDHMSVSMSLSFMQHGMNTVQQKIDSNSLTAEDIQGLIALGEEIEQKFSEIKEVADVVLPVMGSPTNIHVAQNGELNRIFMDPSSGIEFFDGIITGEVNAENVKGTIEAGNVDSADEIHVDLREVSNDLNGSISRMAESINNMTPEQRLQMLRALEGAADQAQTNGSPNSQPSGSSETADETNEKKSFFEQLLEMFKNMFKGIIDFGKENGFIEDTDGPDEVTDPTEVQTPIATLRASILSKLTEGAFTGMQESSLKEFFESETGLPSMTSIIDEIPDRGEENTTTEKIDNLFFTPISSDESVMKIDAFIDAGSLEGYKNADSSLNSENLLRVLTAYKNYRIAHSAEESEDTQLTYEAYFTNNNE